MSLVQPIRLGVFFDQPIDVGGGHQQSLNAALLVKQIPPELASTIFFTSNRANIPILTSLGIKTFYIKISKIRNLLLCLRRLITHPRILSIWQYYFGPNYFEAVFKAHKVELVYFLSPTSRANDLESLNYIMTVWDLCHADYPEFPEVRDFRVFESRERLFRAILPKSVAVIADSRLGKENLIRRYGIDDGRVYVLNFSPAIGVKDSLREIQSSILDIRSKYNLLEPYIFYPAQFWAHKNHIYILEGLITLQKEFGHSVGAIFSGGDQGNLAYIKKKVKELGIESRVRFIGFVSNEEIPHLYRQSLALVMPTYFGPTNLPPLEAMSLGVPVLYPNEPGLRDQVGNAAILIDLDNPLTMAKGLASLIEDSNVRDRLSLNAEIFLQSNSDELRLKILKGALEKFQRIKACWQ